MFSDVLKFLRKREGLSQKELARRLGLAQNTISSYEAGRRQPDFETLETIADFFNTSLGTLLGEGDEVKAPAQYLTDLQKKYNALDDHGRELVDLVLGAEYKRCMKAEQQTEIVPFQTIRHYLSSPAAGINGMTSEDYEDIPRTADMPKDADFCLTVSGDSMEPYIHDGQMVYVNEKAQLQEFEVGVWCVNGATYVKQYCPMIEGSTMLLSANPAREDANIYISKESNYSVQYFGKVLLGKKLPKPQYN